jgi:hypothetical protein
MSIYKTGSKRHPIRPTLNLDFANSKQLDSRVSFWRDSVGTYYDEDGILRIANYNEPRFDHDPVTGDSKGLLIERQSYNYQNDGSAMTHYSYWGAYEGAHVVKTAETLAPDATFSAMKFTKSVADNDAYIIKYVALTANQPLTTSFYAKAGTTDQIVIAHSNYSTWIGGNGGEVQFDLTTGDWHMAGVADINTALSGTHASMTYVGNGWWRCTVTNTSSGTGTNTAFAHTERSLNDGTDGNRWSSGKNSFDKSVYLWGIQEERNTNFASSFIPRGLEFTTRNTTASYFNENGVLTWAKINEPRYDYKYDGNRWIPAGQLIESDAYNSFTYSCDFSNWGNDQGGVAPNVTIAPDGTQTADRLFATTANQNHSRHKSFGVNASEYYTFSVFAKRDYYDFVNISWFYNAVDGSSSTTFDLTDGSYEIQSGQGKPTVNVENCGNGWWRLAITHKTSDPVGGSCYVFVSVNRTLNSGALDTWAGDNVKGIYVWGGQMESHGADGNTRPLGPSSFIYTTTSGVTRGADVFQGETLATRYPDYAQIHDISWMNESESTIYGEGTSYTDGQIVGSNPCLWGITDGTSTNRYLLRRHHNNAASDASNSGFTFRYQVSDTGVTYNNDYFAPTGTVPEWDDRGVHKMALAVSENSQVGVADGIDSEMTSIDTPGLALNTFTMAEIGYAGSSEFWCGHIRKIAYYPKALTLNDMKALTESD